MAQAIWNEIIIAESDDIELVEGNAYFPVSAIKMNHLSKSMVAPTYCHWKGIATYYDISVEEKTNIGSAWLYGAPYLASKVIQNRIAFWKGVEVSGGPPGVGLIEPKPSLRDGRTGWEALCWLIRHGRQEKYTEDEINNNTDLMPEELADTWNHRVGQRYAARYEWVLEGGNGKPFRIRNMVSKSSPHQN